MKVFIDANILVAVFNKEYPAYDSCARVLSLAGKNGIEIVCSTLSLGIAYYFAEKKSGRNGRMRRFPFYANTFIFRLVVLMRLRMP
jgi:predicted nucleic acid-binding protein